MRHHGATDGVRADEEREEDKTLTASRFGRSCVVNKPWESVV